jgi:DNA-binding MarR family transcriptional regulator
LPTQSIPKHRRRLSQAEIRAWEAFLLAHAAATRALERDAGPRIGLSLGEHHLLVQLARGPAEGTRPTDLARRSLVTKSGLTRAMERLEAQGLVERRACPTDGRVSYVALTPKGRRTVTRAAPATLRSVAEHFADHLSPRELDVITIAMERIAAVD